MHPPNSLWSFATSLVGAKIGGASARRGATAKKQPHPATRIRMLGKVFFATRRSTAQTMGGAIHTFTGGARASRIHAIQPRALFAVWNNDAAQAASLLRTKRSSTTSLSGNHATPARARTRRAGEFLLYADGLRRASHFTIEHAMFGLAGFTSTRRSLGITTKSMSSMGIAPRST